MKSPILLLKVGGVLTACRRSAHTFTVPRSTGVPSLFGIAVFLLAIVFRPLVMLLVLALLLHMPPHGLSIAGLGVLGTMESNAIVEKRNEFQAKQKEIADVFDLAKDGDRYDFTRAKVLEKLGAKDEGDALAKVRGRNDELTILGQALQVSEMKAIEAANRERAEQLKEPSALVRHPGDPSRTLEGKSFGELAVESKQYREDFLKGAGRNSGVSVIIDMSHQDTVADDCGLRAAVRSNRAHTSKR
jgi:hypothetical protein